MKQESQLHAASARPRPTRRSAAACACGSAGLDDAALADPAGVFLSRQLSAIHNRWPPQGPAGAQLQARSERQLDRQRSSADELGHEAERQRRAGLIDGLPSPPPRALQLQLSLAFEFAARARVTSRAVRPRLSLPHSALTFNHCCCSR